MGKMLDSPRSTTPTGFDPEGDGYDMESAVRAGMKPAGPEAGANVGHWSTREPATGLILKGRKHESFDVGIEEDAKLGYKLVKRGGRYYTAKED